MKMRNLGKFMPSGVFLLGVTALLLRRQLYLTGTDGKGLLLRNTPLETALMLLSAGVLILLFLVFRKEQGPKEYAANYSGSFPGALGHVAAAAGIFLTVYYPSSGAGNYLGRAWEVLGMVSPVCLVLAGISRLLGRKPFFLLHVIPCLFFMVHVITFYQLWSSDPQLQNYLFALLGTLALALFSYYTAAFEADCGSRRGTLVSGLAAVYLCLAELAWSAQPLLYLGGALWVLTGLCSPVSTRGD